MLELAEQDVETREVYALENNSLAYCRAADGSPAVRLGLGTAAISTDGKWVLLASNYVSRFPRLPARIHLSRSYHEQESVPYQQLDSLGTSS